MFVHAYQATTNQQIEISRANQRKLIRTPPSYKLFQNNQTPSKPKMQNRTYHSEEKHQTASSYNPLHNDNTRNDNTRNDNTRNIIQQKVLKMVSSICNELVDSNELSNTNSDVLEVVSNLESSIRNELLLCNDSNQANSLSSKILLQLALISSLQNDLVVKSLCGLITDLVNILCQSMNNTNTTHTSSSQSVHDLETQSNIQSSYLSNSIIDSKDSSSTQQDQQFIDPKYQLSDQLTDLSLDDERNNDQTIELSNNVSNDVSNNDSNDVSINEFTQVLPVRKRGRPRKQRDVIELNDSDSEPEVIKRGKIGNELSITEDVSSQRRRGRSRIPS